MAAPNPSLIYRTDVTSSLTFAQLDGNFAYLSQSIANITFVPSSSLAATASYVAAGNINGVVMSASHALTASYALNGGGTINSSSFATTSSNTFKGNQTISGSIFISGSIIPNIDGSSATSSFSLGSITNAWKDIFVSNGTINFIDDAGNIQATLSSTETGMVLPLTLDLATTSKIESTPSSSGDGSNASTLTLKPDTNLKSDQYVILDPTAPNHIHIRAGGTIDESTADLFIGGEKNHLLVSDSSQYLRLNSQRIIYTNYYNFTPDSGFSTSEWSTDEFGNHIITINNPTQDVYNAAWAFGGPSIFAVTVNGNYQELTVISTNTPGDPNPITVTVTEAPPANPSTLDQIVYDIGQYRDTFVNIDNDITIEAADDVRIYSNDTFSLRNYSPNDPISIRTDYNNNDYAWEFNPNGNTLFPYLTTPRGDTNSGDLITNTLKLGDGFNEAVISTPNGIDGSPNSQRLVINPGQGSGSGEGGDIYLWAGRGGVDGGSGGDIKVRGGYGLLTGGGGYVRIEGGDTADGTAGFVEIKGGNSSTGQGGDVYIYGGFGDGNTQNGDVTITTYDNLSNAKNWNFATDGTFTIPDVLQLTVRTTDPASPVEGMIMASGSVGSSALYYYNGTTWIKLTASK